MWGTALVVAWVVGVPQVPARVIEVPFEKLTLANGLEVVLHVDHQVPTVHVETWYHVGARDEAPGRTGIVHLFEHLMFDGTKHIAPGGVFSLLDQAGASQRNGSTRHDQSVFYETLPSNRLELALWLESSRMGFLLDRPGLRAALALQRDVIESERRTLVDGAPLGTLRAVELGALYPGAHPYGHEVMGARGDVAGLREEDLTSFFTRHYAPGNASLVIAGDLDPAATRRLVEQYFGPLATAPAPIRRAVPEATPGSGRRLVMEARVAAPSALFAWPTVPAFAPGDAELDLLARVLAGGKASRLHRGLVDQRKLAQGVSARQASYAQAGRFEIYCTARAGQDPAALERAVAEELGRLRAEPVSEAELEGARSQVRAELLRGLETLEGRASQLMKYNFYTGDPGFLARDLERYQAVDAAALTQTARRLLRDDVEVVITVEPNPAAPVAGRIKDGGRS